jgi:RNA polymerase sigma-70 factor, ECF subfamily
VGATKDLFRPVLEEHYASVVGFLCRLVEDQTVAEELAEDVFVRAYYSLNHRASADKHAVWLFRSATKLASEWLRDGRMARAPEPELTQAPIRRAMAALPTNQRAAVLMHKFEGFGYGQIAHILGCSHSAVQLLLSQAYQKLRGQMLGASHTLALPTVADPPPVSSIR